MEAQLKGEAVVVLSHEAGQHTKRGRGRTAGSVSKKAKAEMSRKKDRPETESLTSDLSAGISDSSSQDKFPVKSQKRGRPPKADKDSTSKAFTAPRKIGRTRKTNKEPARRTGRAAKANRGRGRPRKTALTPEEEQARAKNKSKGPRVWKPLGRPRIYPRPDAPAPSSPRKRGRPAKSKKSAHLPKKIRSARKRGQATLSTSQDELSDLLMHDSSDELPSKRPRATSPLHNDRRGKKAGKVRGDKKSSSAVGQRKGRARKKVNDEEDEGYSAEQHEDTEEEESYPTKSSGRKKSVPRKVVVAKSNKNGKAEQEMSLRRKAAPKGLTSIL